MIDTFSENPEYLSDIQSENDQTNFWDLGIELSQPARGMQVWTFFQIVGMDAIQETIDQALDFGK